MITDAHRSSQLEFCDEFGFPPEVKEHWEEILAQLNPQKTLAVLLHGSTARGELSWERAADGRLELRSDYEFQIVARSAVDQQDYARLRGVFQGMEQRIGAGSPLFHIDFSYITRQQFRRLPLRFITFEKKQAGRIVYGEDIRGEIPEVTLANLDYRELRSVIIWRLWALLLFAPESWVNGRGGAPSGNRLFHHVIGRNILDLTTLLLPLEGVLIPSFARRIRHVSDNYIELGRRWQFSQDLLETLNEAYAVKMAGRAQASIDDLYARAILAFWEAGAYALRRDCSASCVSDVGTHFVRHARRLLQDGSPRFRAYYLTLWAKGGVAAWIKGPRGLTTPMLGVALAFLYQMHLACLSNRQGRVANALGRLDEAAMWWRRLEWREQPPLLGRDADFGARWLELRRRFVSTFQWFHPGVRQQGPYLNRVLAVETVNG